MNRYRHTRRDFLRAISVGAAVSVTPKLLSAAPPTQKPNIVLVLTDNQSYYELSSHGHNYVRTPRIDALAAQGVDFSNFYAAPYCSPSRGSLMTGRYSLRSGIHNTIGGFCILNRREHTVADHLKKAGYKTGIFGKWHLGHSYPYQPERRGFDEAFVMRGGFIGQMQDYIGNSYVDGVYEHNGKDCKTRGHSTDVLFGKAAEFIKTNKDNPFFAFISTPAVHDFAPHAKTRERMIRRKGLEELSKSKLNLFSGIENIDDNVGKVLEQLDRLKLSDKTMVIVATDQGMYGRGNPKGVKLNSAQGYDSRHHVFCIVHYPPWQGRRHESNALAGMVDLMPTMLDAAGIPIPRNVDGRSLRPLLAGQAAWTDDRKLIIQCPRGRERKKNVNVSVKTQRWRLVNGSGLYDAQGDWRQKTDVAADNPKVVARLTAHYEEFWGSLPPVSQVLPVQVLTGPNGLETRLDAHYWYKGDQPFRQGQLKGQFNGTWAVEAPRDGLYQFDLRRYPKDAPKAIGATKATLTVGSQSVTASMDASDVSATLELALTKGVYDMTTSFNNAQWGAYFVYVRHTGPTRRRRVLKT